MGVVDGRHISFFKRPLVGGTGRGFMPSDVSNLKAWFRADQGLTVSGGFVTQWNDLSGQGNHVTQSTPAAQPSDAIAVAALGGQKAVQLPTARYLQRSNFTGGALANSTVYVVGVILNETRFWVDGGNGTNRNGLFEQSTALEQYAGAIVGTATVAGATGLGFWARGTFLATASSSNQLSVNTKTAVTATGNCGTLTMDGVTIGAGGDLSGLGGGGVLSIAEVVVYGSALSLADRTSLAAYFRNRYGLT